MKRYLLFQFDQYYPCGGWDDFESAFDTIEEAKAKIRPSYDYYQIVDLETLKEVELND